MKPRPALRLVEPEPTLLDLFRQRDAAIAEAKALDQRIAAGVREWSYARGFRVPVRPEQCRRELENGNG